MASGTELQVDLDTVTGLLVDEGDLSADRASFLLDALEAATDDALRVLGERIECHTAHGGVIDSRLATLRSRARSREAKAAVAFFAARAAEGTGEPSTAREFIDEALGFRPSLEPALHDGAHYAATRGDYVTADRYLRRAELPSPLRPGLSTVMAVSATHVPRNDLCPCGSGRKFKVCCRREDAPPLKARAQLLYALLGTYAERGPGMQTITPLLDRTGDPQRCAMFCLDLALGRGGLAERFLATRGSWLRADERELLERWQRIPVTLYEILRVRRDDGVLLRALPAGVPEYVSDARFAQSAQRLDLLCGRLLFDGTGPCLLMQPVQIPRHHRRALQELLASNPSAEQIADFLAPEPPVQLRNTDGEEVHRCRVTFRVSPAGQVFAQLGERLTRVGTDTLARTRTLPDGRVLSLGQLQRVGQDLVLTANSAARLAELETILRDVAPEATARDRHAERLGPDPEPDGRVGRTVILESYLLVPDSTDSTAGSEQGARAAETAWLETPGVIGELSPRAAARHADPAIRAELHSVVDDIEAIRLQALGAGESTAGLMDPERLRAALATAESGQEESGPEESRVDDVGPSSGPSGSSSSS